MSFTPHELRQLAVTFPREHAAQINAKSAKYGMPREDIRQELSLICLEKGAEFVSSGNPPAKRARLEVEFST